MSTNAYAQLVHLALRYQSQRMLSRELGVSQTLISMLLSKRRAITPELASKIDASCREAD